MCPLNSEFEKRVIWNFADEVEGKPADIWRIDSYGSLISWPEYGQTSPFGWKIVEVYPGRNGISISNKQALHWMNACLQRRRTAGGRMKAEG